MNDNLFHDSSFLQVSKQLREIESRRQQFFVRQTDRCAVLDQGAQDAALFDLPDEHCADQSLVPEGPTAG